MSAQSALVLVLVALSAGWFALGLCRSFRTEPDCNTGCSGCAKACPLGSVKP